MNNVTEVWIAQHVFVVLTNPQRNKSIISTKMYNCNRVDEIKHSDWLRVCHGVYSSEP